MHRMRVVPVVVLTLALVTLASGCGAESRKAPVDRAGESSVSAADLACRGRWQALGDELGAKATRGVAVQRAFESRWASIEAGVGYYATTAKADQCGDLLTKQRQAIEDLDGVIARALPYDVERRSAAAVEARTIWRAAHPGRREPKAVRQAYRTLQDRVVAASRALSPALTELATVDPARTTAVRRAVQDLVLLAGTSDAYVACKQALAKVWAFHHPPKKKPAGKKPGKKPGKKG